MRIEEIDNKQQWDEFITSQTNYTFLHSWNWGDFNVQMGDKVWRLGAYEKDNMLAAALVIKVHARRGNFLFIPHGPIFAEGGRGGEVVKQLVEYLIDLAKQEKVNFIRISPLLDNTKENRQAFNQVGFRPAPIHMHAETLWILDIRPKEEEILAGMRKNTRNLIRRAAKEGVEVEGNLDVDTFYELHLQTVAKHNFVPFSKKYIITQIKEFARNGRIKVFTAWHNNRPLASAVIVFYGNSAYYHHGASLPGTKIPASYAVQWEAIKEAKKQGRSFYNLWGIVAGSDLTTRHAWAGITHFKKGFGGFQKDYLPAQDLPLSWFYWPNYILETIRRKRRRL